MKFIADYVETCLRKFAVNFSKDKPANFICSVVAVASSGFTDVDVDVEVFINGLYNRFAVAPTS